MQRSKRRILADTIYIQRNCRKAAPVGRTTFRAFAIVGRHHAQVLRPTCRGRENG